MTQFQVTMKRIMNLLLVVDFAYVTNIWTVVPYQGAALKSETEDEEEVCCGGCEGCGCNSIM
ncbi:hypothetical protein H6758_01460 [Candidatus Nomurabacteria bacterium]|nr:hypothetical protein [Candidatus Nomurabacteria bacterium]